MTRNKIHALLFAAAVAVCGMFPGVSARSAPSPAQQSQKIIKEEFQVVQMSYTLLQVRSFDMREHFTFTFSPQIRDQMQNIFNAAVTSTGTK